MGAGAVPRLEGNLCCEVLVDLALFKAKVTTRIEEFIIQSVPWSGKSPCRGCGAASCCGKCKWKKARQRGTWSAGGSWNKKLGSGRPRLSLGAGLGFGDLLQGASGARC